MARVCLTFCFVLMQWHIFVFGEDSENVTTSILNETIINVTVPIPKESYINVTVPIPKESYINVTIPIPKESYINVTNQVLNETYYGNGSDSILNDPVLEVLHVSSTTSTPKIASAWEGLDPKSVLRYGHHRTYECEDFVQAYKCIARCLKNGHDIAVADKSCSCTCLEDKEKAKYHELATEFKIPTTTKPAWAVSSTSPTTTMSGRTKVIGGEHIYYQSDEGSSVEKNMTESDHSHEHTEEDSEEHASSEHSSEGHSSEDHSSEHHSSEHHSSEEHTSSEEHPSSEEHGTEEHESEDHPTEEHESEEHHSEEHHSEEHHSDEAEAEERADVGAEID